METKKMVLAAILTAISVVIDTTFKLMLPTQLVGVPFYAIPLVIGAIILGPKYSVIMALLGDLTSVLISGQTALPLFALGAMMWGLIPGLLLHRKYKSLIQIVLVVFLSHLVVTSVNSLALYVHFHKSLAGLLVDLPLRLALLTPNTLIISSLSKAVMEAIAPAVTNQFKVEFI